MGNIKLGNDNKINVQINSAFYVVIYYVSKYAHYCNLILNQ